MIREIQKYHDGRYKSIDAVYLCGEIGNPDKERLFVPFDKVMELIDELNDTKAFAKATAIGSFLHKTYARKLKAAVLALKGGEQDA